MSNDDQTKQQSQSVSGAPTQESRNVAIQAKGSPYYWSLSGDIFHLGQIVAAATSPNDDRAQFALEIVRRQGEKEQIVKIRDSRGCYVKVEGRDLYATGLDPTMFRMTTVDVSTVTLQQSNDEYVYGAPNSYYYFYEIYADGQGGEGEVIDFVLVDPSPASTPITLQSVAVQNYYLKLDANFYGVTNAISAVANNVVDATFESFDRGDGSIALKASNSLFVGAFTTGMMHYTYELENMMCARLNSGDDANAAIKIEVISGDGGYGSTVRLRHVQSGCYYKAVYFNNMGYGIQAITTDSNDPWTSFYIDNPST